MGEPELKKCREGVLIRVPKPAGLAYSETVWWALDLEV